MNERVGPVIAFGIGILATLLVYVVVRLFPKQEYPEDNARVAAFAFAGSYFINMLGLMMLSLQ